MTLLSMNSHSSVDRVPTQCWGGHGFNSLWGPSFFLCPTLLSCWSVHFSQVHVQSTAVSPVKLALIKRQRSLSQDIMMSQQWESMVSLNYLVENILSSLSYNFSLFLSQLQNSQIIYLLLLCTKTLYIGKHCLAKK